MQVGVLAVQGDFAEHERALALCGVASTEVRRPGDFANLQGLVLPGGESTTMLRLLGFDHERLTFRHAGRDFRLTDVHGRVEEELIA